MVGWLTASVGRRLGGSFALLLALAIGLAGAAVTTLNVLDLAKAERVQRGRRYQGAQQEDTADG